MHDNLKIIALVGLAGSGKTTATEYLTSKGNPKVYFGGVILGEMEKAGIEINPENEKKFREDFRAKHGDDFVVNEIIKEIENLADAGQHRIVADGLYSWSEYKVLKQRFHNELIVVAVVASKHQRYHRLSKRPIRPLNGAEAHERDISEIENLEKGGPIAIADYYLINNGSYEDFYKQIDEVLEHSEF